MKKWLLVTLMALSSSLAMSQEMSSEGDTAVGIVVGSVDGISLWQKTAEDQALQGTLSIGDDSFYVGADALFESKEIFRSPHVVPYAGIGAFYSSSGEFAKDNRSTAGGLRVPLGLRFDLPNTPVQLAAEVAPSLLVEPISAGFAQGQMMMRVRF